MAIPAAETDLAGIEGNMRMGLRAVLAVALAAGGGGCGDDEAAGLHGTEGRIQGLAIGLVGAQDEPVDRLTLKAGRRGRTQVLAVGFADDAVGCAGKFSTAVAPDAVEADVLNVEVEYEHVPGTACGGGITVDACDLTIPALPAGDYTLRLFSNGCREGCLQRVEGETHINVPVTVRP